MTTRNLPKIEAFAKPDVAIDWDPPEDVRDKWSSVEAVAAGGDRVINITDRIGSDGMGGGVTVGYVRGALARMGPGDITVNINSPGGDFFDGIAMYNYLREHDGAVTTNVMGVAASAASVIAFASDTLNIAKSAFLMIHNSHAVAIGNRHDMTNVADMLAQFDKAMAGLYADRSGIKQDKIAAYMDAETFFSGQDAVDAGLADAVLPADQVTQTKNNSETKALAERRAEMAMREGGLSSRESKKLVAQLKSVRRDVEPHHATRDAGAEMVAKMLRDLAKTVSA